MGAKLFRVVMKAAAGCRLRERPGDEPARWLFSYSGGVVHGMAIDDLVTVVSDIPLSTGLRFTVELEADDAESAATTAGTWAETAAIFLATTRRAPIGTLFPDVAYEVTPEVAERQFLQWFWDLPVFRTAPAIPYGSFEALHSKIHALGSSPATEAKMWRLVLSMSWFRQGLDETESIFRFLKLWLALEAVGPLLKKHYKITHDAGFQAIRRAAAGAGLGEAWVSRALGVRRKLFHTMRVKRSQLQAASREMVDDLEQLLAFAWLLLMDLPTSTMPPESVTPYLPHARLRAVLLHPDATMWNWDVHPYFDAVFGATRDKTTDPREVRFGLSQQYVAHNLASYRPIDLLTGGPGGPGRVRIDSASAEH